MPRAYEEATDSPCHMPVADREFMDQTVEYLSEDAASFTFSEVPADQQPANGRGCGVLDACLTIGRSENVPRYGA